MQDIEKQQIVTFVSLWPSNVQYFLLEKLLDD